jgi:drug/metabolite transporter (DMT)-like permease
LWGSSGSLAKLAAIPPGLVLGQQLGRRSPAGLILIIDIRKRWPIRRKTMNWFRRTASIAGIQVPNYWMLVLVAVIVIWIIYSAFIH